MTDEETAVVDAYLRFCHKHATMLLDETPWWQGSRRKVLRLRLAVLDSLRRQLASDEPPNRELAERVAAHAR